MSETEGQRLEKTDREPEEQARANLYGLIGRLFYEPPDSDLLAKIACSPAGEAGDGDLLSNAWSRLQAACSGADPAVVRQEYDSLFVGVGKAAATPYLSAYAEPHAPDRHLVKLRARLGAWGLARRASAFEVEDHVSGVCDVMRWLIESGRPLADQRAFFEEFVYEGALAFLTATQKTPTAVFYQGIAGFARDFFQLEAAAFEMD